jgi:predicted dehydrogenase
MSTAQQFGPGNDVTRRDFIKGTIAAGAVAGGSLGAFYFGYSASLSKPVRVGVLGTGDEGCVLIGAINPEFIEVRSIADIRPFSIYRAFHGEVGVDARPGLLKVYGWKSEHEARKHVKVYDHDNGGYEELIRNAKEDGIEAVIITLPLHLHAPAAIMAMNAGLHVMTEKLMGHTVGACKAMARVANRTWEHGKGLYLATGHQRHYNIRYFEAVEMIRSGKIGQLHFIQAQWHRGNIPGTDSWQQPMPKDIKPEDAQAKRLLEMLEAAQRELAAAKTAKEIETAMAKVALRKAQIADAAIKDKAVDYGYTHKTVKDAQGKPQPRPPAEELIRWRLWDRTGAGLMAELGSHQLDAASIFIAAAHDGKKQYPLNVAAAASRSIFPPDRDVEDHVYCIFEFPAPGYDPKDTHHGAKKKIGVQYSSINGNGFGGYGEIVHGTNGGFVLEREQTLSPFKGAEVQATVASGPASVGPTLDTQASAAVAVAAGAGGGPVSRGYREELEHWAWCIRNRSRENMPRCHPEVALTDAVIALTANKAAREGRRIEFKKEWFDIESNLTPDDSEDELKRYGV